MKVKEDAGESGKLCILPQIEETMRKSCPDADAPIPDQNDDDCVRRPENSKPCNDAPITTANLQPNPFYMPGNFDVSGFSGYSYPSPYMQFPSPYSVSQSPYYYTGQHPPIPYEYTAPPVYLNEKEQKSAKNVTKNSAIHMTIAKNIMTIKTCEVKTAATMHEGYMAERFEELTGKVWVNQV